MDKVNSVWIRAVVKAAYLEGYLDGTQDERSPLRGSDEAWENSDQKVMLDMKYPEE